MNYNITVFNRTFWLCLFFAVIFSCSKETKQNQEVQSTSRIEHKTVIADKESENSFYMTMEDSSTSDVTFADNNKVVSLTEKFIEDYQKGGGRSAKTMETIKFYRDLLTNDLLSAKQKLFMIQNWIDNHPYYLGTQGALFCLYSNILQSSDATTKDKLMALNGCGEIHSSFYYDEDAIEVFEKALTGYKEENDYFHITKILENMGKLYAEHQNNEKQALTMFEQALEFGEKFDDYNVVPTQINVIRCLKYLNKLDKAEDFINEVMLTEPNSKRLQEEKANIEMIKGPPVSRVFRGRNRVTIIGSDLDEIPGLQSILNVKNNLKTREFLRQMLRSLIEIEQKNTK